MTTEANGNLGLLSRLLTLVGLVFIVAAYFSPIWWVSLTAPQYPDDAFPQGIRIHFHVDSVSNGCKKVVVKERHHEEEALNCKHEMDAINHYVGMYPISSGGPVERAYAPFMFSLLVLMLLTFMVPGQGKRAVVFAGGGAAIIGWMSLAMMTKGGMAYLSPNYIYDLTTTMSLYDEDWADWSGMMAIKESYSEGLGRYFRDVVNNNKAVAVMMTAANVVYWAIIAAVIVVAIGLWKFRPTMWLLALVPAALPIFFVVEYAAWLWWFGHSLHEMAAFTVKPFMPTVLGQGKVAQFATYSYPHYGFGFFVATFFALALAMLLRRKQMKENGE
ncbi:MAG: hypothetical protein OQK35_06935 [Alphaproteobacteria bacterium]|nr:hypothetical protein [Rhodospirillales bacterium]MCW9046053.1 hypothetical protein [Alphaproteobacteria bacterium]